MFFLKFLMMANFSKENCNARHMIFGFLCVLELRQNFIKKHEGVKHYPCRMEAFEA